MITLVIKLVYAALSVFELLFIGRIIISFVTMFSGKTNRFFDMVYMVTEPVLAPIRNFLNKSEMLRSLPIDFSPIVVFLAIDIIKNILWK